MGERTIGDMLAAIDASEERLAARRKRIGTLCPKCHGTGEVKGKTCKHCRHDEDYDDNSPNSGFHCTRCFKKNPGFRDVCPESPFAKSAAPLRPRKGTKPLHERAAEAIGLPSTWLDDARAAPPKPPTAECLEPDEIVSLELLTPDRHAHLTACAFCKASVAASRR